MVKNDQKLLAELFEFCILKRLQILNFSYLVHHPLGNSRQSVEQKKD